LFRSRRCFSPVVPAKRANGSARSADRSQAPRAGAGTHDHNCSWGEESLRRTVRNKPRRRRLWVRAFAGTTTEFLLGLLHQMRVRAAEVGRSRILTDLDDAASNRTGARKMLEQRLAVAAADRAGEF